MQIKRTELAKVRQQEALLEAQLRRMREDSQEKPARPVGDGGWGAVQATLRYDYLDLNDRTITGGTQNALIGALVWTPVEFLRLNVNYAHLRYTDAAILAGSDADYSVDVIGWRAELDF